MKTVSEFISNLVCERVRKAKGVLDLMDVRSDLGNLEFHFKTDPKGFAEEYEMPEGLQDDLTEE